MVDFDPYNPSDLRAAQQYETDLFTEAKANPRFQKGMLVKLIGCAKISTVPIARVLDMKWSDVYSQYQVQVLHDGEAFWCFEQFLIRWRSGTVVVDVFINGGEK